jgi:hypothetical protein
MRGPVGGGDTRPAHASWEVAYGKAQDQADHHVATMSGRLKKSCDNWLRIPWRIIERCGVLFDSHNHSVFS